jgi:HK97 family phage prohead protease
MALLHKKLQAKKDASDPVMYKNITCQIDTKTLSVTGRTVTGYLSAFKNRDSDNDILMPGCFAKSLAERGVGTTGGNTIAHLWQHKMDTPLGSYTVLKEDDYGLYFECVYDDIQKANDALVQFKSGTLKNFSIGYAYVWDKMEYMDYCEKDNAIVMPGGCCPQCGSTTLSYCFIIKEVELYEGSVVTLAANPMALYTGMKSEQRDDELRILKEEAQEILSTLKPRKRFELSQIITKLSTLASIKPPLDEKEALKREAEEKAKKEKEEKGSEEEKPEPESQSADAPKRKFGKLGMLVKE